MRHFLSLLILQTSCLACAQDFSRDIRMGLGGGFLGTGDYPAAIMEAEYNLYKNEKTSTSFSLAAGNSILVEKSKASFFQVNMNRFRSPFGRKGFNDFRLGLGLSAYYFHEVYLSSAFYQNNQLVDEDYTFDSWGAVGLNLIIEKAWQLRNDHLISARVYTQPYFNGDVIHGLNLKFGFGK